MLSSLTAEVFRGLTNIKELHLRSNGLTELSGRLFQGLGHLNILNLATNNLTELPRELFIGLRSPQELSLDRNELMAHLYWSRNQLTTIPYNLLHGLFGLKSIALQYNDLENLDGRLFKDAKTLDSISLNNNKLHTLNSTIFKGLSKRSVLFLSSNQFSQLDSELFKDLLQLTYVDLRNNLLTNIPSLKKLTLLTFLDLADNDLTYVDGSSFAGLAKGVDLLVSQHEICNCYVQPGISCSASDNRSPYLTCDRLLSDRVLVILMWLIGINALGGNIFVLAWRRKAPQKSKVQDALLSNLALSDMLMGIYMLIIASADIYFGQHFPMRSETWRSGITCRIAGAISIISSEASVFFVTFIIIDRFICIRFPFSTRKFTKTFARVIAVITWIFSLSLGVIPSILSGRNFKFYDNSHVCIGLPLALVRRFRTTSFVETIFVDRAYLNKLYFQVTPLGSFRGLYFSSAMFLGLNCLCYFIIFACYVEIVRAALKSSRQAKLNKEMKDQIRMTAKVYSGDRGYGLLLLVSHYSNGYIGTS